MSPMTLTPPTIEPAAVAARRDLTVPPVADAAASRRALRAMAGAQATWLRERPGGRRPA
ncbi:hypothetical protein DSM112329_00650 [Paraconexibacter sp. AEG42_29]|uniref:Uncharacterized protein n=1 Tax=Paraconexibacter sp. AEG42_29 TaxID=2997339 RepID=A0AAU7AQE1_9ACTN